MHVMCTLCLYIPYAHMTLQHTCTCRAQAQGLASAPRTPPSQSAPHTTPLHTVGHPPLTVGPHPPATPYSRPPPPLYSRLLAQPPSPCSLSAPQLGGPLTTPGLTTAVLTGLSAPGTFLHVCCCSYTYCFVVIVKMWYNFISCHHHCPGTCGGGWSAGAEFRAVFYLFILVFLCVRCWGPRF